MRNERNAGRKPKISDKEMNDIIGQIDAGVSVSKISGQYGVSRQALYKRLKAYAARPVWLDYLVEGKLCTLIEADFRKESIQITNYTIELSKRAFGYKNAPDWDDFVDFLEKYYLGDGDKENGKTFCLTGASKGISLSDLPVSNGAQSFNIYIDPDEEIPTFKFERKDLMLYRSDTDGFQMKAITHDRRHFVKSQAVISGVKLRDWAVEIIATDICCQLGIPCIEQTHCRFAYGKQMFDAVYSQNFELDGYTFISFESILERMHLSSKDDEFIRLSAMDKLIWCAEKLAETGDIPFDEAERYMINLAVLDCLVGNVDRHTRNFGLFFNSISGKWQIPPVFDSGMGLFEHDSYRDSYKTFNEAMNSVYVSPYGEDPFEMLLMLNEKYRLKSLYKDVKTIHYPNILQTEFALEYERRMNALWQKLD